MLVMPRNLPRSTCFKKLVARKRYLTYPDDIKYSSETSSSSANSKLDPSLKRIDYDRLIGLAKECIPKQLNLGEEEESVDFAAPPTSSPSCGTSEGEPSPKNGTDDNVVGSWVLESLGKIKITSAPKEARGPPIDVKKLKKMRDQAAGFIPQDNTLDVYYGGDQIQPQSIKGGVDTNAGIEADMGPEKCEGCDVAPMPQTGYWAKQSSRLPSESLESRIGEIEKEMDIKAQENLKMDCSADSGDEDMHTVPLVT
jgi:hypothetical protein